MSTQVPDGMAVRQVPGWWPALVRAECERCPWTGPTRDLYQNRAKWLLQYDVDDHRCES